MNASESNVGVYGSVPMLLHAANDSSTSYASHSHWRSLHPNSCRTLQRCIYQKGSKDFKTVNEHEL
jgi:hypothetical protein